MSNAWLSLQLCVRAALIALLFSAPALGEVNQKQTLAASFSSQAVTLDGTLAEPIWNGAQAAKGFYNLTTRRPASPDTATSAFIVYTSDTLYVGFACTQTLPITENQTTNGVGEETDDQVEVNIDTSGNGSRVYTFKTTPRGVRYQSSSESDRFDPSWRAAAARGRDGWSVVLAIPLRALRAGSSPWRVNFQRRIAANDEEFSWVYDPNMSGPDDSRYWPTVTGLRLGPISTRPPPHADIYGLGSFGLDKNLFAQPDGSFAYQKQRDYGVDVTYPFTNTLALVGTANPDFSNVEVDQQTIAPQQFQRVLSEYRPFFAQGSSYLTPDAHSNVGGSEDEIFYSPSIGTFNWGAQIEGTAKSASIGLLDVGGPGFADQAFGFEQRTPDQSFGYSVDGVLAHHTQDGSSVTPCFGTILVCRDDTYDLGLSGQSSSTGLSERIAYASESGDFVSDPGLAHSLALNLGESRQYYDVFFHYDDIGPSYAPVDGYTLLNDLRGPGIFTDANGTGEKGSSIKTWSAFAGGDRDLDHSGQVRFAQWYGGFNLDLQNKVSFDANLFDSEQRTSDGYPTYAQSQTLPYDQTSVGLNYARDSASPIALTYSFGPFATLCSQPLSTTTPNPLFCGPYPNLYAPFYLQQLQSSVTHQLSTHLSVSAELDGSDERPPLGPSDGQWLRRFSIGENVSPNATISVGLRSISGTGGFAEPGLNLAASFHDRFPQGNELFCAFGSPAASVTLDRVIVKYIIHFGGGTGT